jgi:hypothetical protein
MIVFFYDAQGVAFLFSGFPFLCCWPDVIVTAVPLFGNMRRFLAATNEPSAKLSLTSVLGRAVCCCFVIPLGCS